MCAEEDPDAEVAAGRKKLPGLTLTLHVEPRPYELGEPIPIRMRYTYAGERKLALSHVTYDRCGRICAFGFEAADDAGTPARDPLHDYLVGGMGGISAYGRLRTGETYAQEVLLNEWLTFDRPGRYSVTAWSNLIHFDPTGSGHPSGPTIPLRSEPVEVMLVEPTQASRDARFGRAMSQVSSRSWEEREQAMQALRFLVDPRAIPRLVEGLFDPHGNVRTEALFGLLSFPDLDPVREAVLHRAESEAFDASDVGSLVAILSLAELRAAGLDGGWQSKSWIEVYREVESKWKRKLRDALLDHIANAPGAERARRLVNAMAMGPAVPRDDPMVWRVVLDHIGGLGNETGRAVGLIEDCLRIEEFLPDLRRIAGDASLGPGLRSAAVIALFAMGDESSSDRLLEDLGREKPIFHPRAHRRVMEARGEEAAARLVEAYEAHEDGRDDTARRIHDLDAPVPAATLSELTRAARRRGRSGFAYLLRALAKRSSATALRIVEACLERPPFGPDREREVAIEVLARLDLPTAEHLRRRVLLTSEEEGRLRLVGALGGAKTATRHVPDLLLLARGDPSGEVRSAAERVLVEATGLPEHGLWGKTRKEHQMAFALWERWWEENGPRYGRWGPVDHGMALLLTASSGVYSPDDPIELTVRLRREDGAAALRSEVQVVVDGFPRSTSPWRPVPTGGAATSASLGAEAVYAVRLEEVPVLRRKGAHTIQVAAALRDPEGKRPEASRIVPSAPIRIRIR